MVTADTGADDIEDALAETGRSGLSLVLIIRSALIAVAIIPLLLAQGVPCGLFGAGIAFVFLGIE